METQTSYFKTAGIFVVYFFFMVLFNIFYGKLANEAFMSNAVVGVYSAFKIMIVVCGVSTLLVRLILKTWQVGKTLSVLAYWWFIPFMLADVFMMGCTFFIDKLENFTPTVHLIMFSAITWGSLLVGFFVPSIFLYKGLKKHFPLNTKQAILFVVVNLGVVTLVSEIVGWLGG